MPSCKMKFAETTQQTILDYRAVLEVCQEEMKSIIFFGIDKEDMVKVR